MGLQSTWAWALWNFIDIHHIRALVLSFRDSVPNHRALAHLIRDLVSHFRVLAHLFQGLFVTPPLMMQCKPPFYLVIVFFYMLIVSHVHAIIEFCIIYFCVGIYPPQSQLVAHPLFPTSTTLKQMLPWVWLLSSSRAYWSLSIHILWF